MKQFLLLIAAIAMVFSRIFAQTATPPSGSGTSANPYLIASLENLYWVTQNASSWSKYFKQTANIDASNSSGWASGSGFSPIGNAGTAFTGTYDGNHYTISNLYINRPSTNYVGMFGNSTTATIKNLGLVNVNITGNLQVGGLIGSLGGSATITNCYTTGSVAGDSLVGGLVGLISNSTGSITNCYSTATVTGSGQFIGGFVGKMDNISSTTVNSCYSTGNVSGTTLGASNMQFVGGFVGLHDNNNSILNCYSRGNVSASGKIAGGFAGYNADTLVTCYSTGTVSASSNAGGFCGWNSYTASACFWDTQTSGTSTAVGLGSATGITGKTTAEMKTASTFTSAGWDFTTVWEMVGTNYPRLRNNPDAALPVELVSFSAKGTNTSVELKWSTATEVNNYGFEIEKRMMKDEGGSAKLEESIGWETIGFVEGAGNSNTAREYSYTDSKLNAGKYSYRLKQIDRDGKFEYSQEVEVNIAAPLVFELKQNYPNPFNPTTTIEFTIPSDGLTTLKIYNVIGQEVATLVNEELKAGTYHQVIFNARGLASGVYFARLYSTNQTQLKKLLLMK